MADRTDQKSPRLHGARVPMDPLVLDVVFHEAGEDAESLQSVHLDLGVLQRDAAQEVSSGEDADLPNAQLVASVSFDGETLEIVLSARSAAVVDSCTLTLRHAFATDESVLLNGYQSWTDTEERPAWSRMRGLRGVSPRLVERYVLDGGGDYDIVDYAAKRGRLHGFTYATFRRGNGMVLVGSLDESHGFTLVKTDASRGEVILQTECSLSVLEAGAKRVAGRYAIARGTMKECYDRWFELAGVRARPVKALVGYTSWYRHYGDIDFASLKSDLAGMSSFFTSNVPFKLEDVQKTFQIDDGFCKVGDWLHVDSQKFPQGLAPLAARIAREGFLPGLWLAPFVCEKDSRLFRECPEWLLRDEAGNPVPTGSHWSGGFALDTRNVEVRSYVLNVLQTITREWGFRLIKADFLYAACKVAHGGLNRGELMADALDLLRRGVGEDVLILGCGVPLGSAFGRLDYCRIGCDVGLDWDDLPHMRGLHRERISTKNSLTSTYARAPLDGRAFGNDPDVFFLRRDVRLTESQRDELLFADADLGSVLLTSDDMGAWSLKAKKRYLEALRIVVERQAYRNRDHVLSAEEDDASEE